MSISAACRLALARCTRQPPAVLNQVASGARCVGTAAYAEVSAVGDGSSTTVNTGSDTFIMQTASCGQALQYFLGSVIGSSQNALAEAAQEAKISLGEVLWRAEVRVEPPTSEEPQRIAAITLKAETKQHVPQAQLDALKERAMHGSSITTLLVAAGCQVNMQLTPPAWMFKSSMGTWMEAELLHRS